MIKRLFAVFAAALIITAAPLCVRAEGIDLTDDIAESGAASLPDELPEEARQTMKLLGLGEVDPQAIVSLTPDEVVGLFADTFVSNFRVPFSTLGVIIGIMLMNVLLEGIRSEKNSVRQNETFTLVSLLAVCGSVAVPLFNTINATCDAISDCGSFANALAPVFAGILIAGGGAVSAGAYQTAAIWAAQIIITVAERIVTPFLSAYIALSITSCAAPNLELNGIVDFIRKSAVWVLTLATTVYVGFMGLQTFMTTKMDGAAAKAAKFIISSSVPAVGGALSDALSSVQGSVGILKTGVGAYGIAATIVTLLPSFVSVLLWIFTLSLAGAVGDVFGFKKLSALLKSFSGGLSLLIATLISTSTALIFSSAVLLTLTQT